jgi:hypothetical protein
MKKRESTKKDRTSHKTSVTDRGTLRDDDTISVVSRTLTLKTDTPDNLILAERIRDIYKGKFSKFQ